MTLSKQTIGYGIAAIVAILCNTVLTWVKEENPAVNALMAQLLYHHWIAHGVAIVGVFLICGFVLSRLLRPAAGRGLATWLLVATVAAGAGIAALFLLG